MSNVLFALISDRSLMNLTLDTGAKEVQGLIEILKKGSQTMLGANENFEKNFLVKKRGMCKFNWETAQMGTSNWHKFHKHCIGFGI